ncbi:hypothetical protein C7120_09095 [Prevotella sp. oral taxon 376]|nr:hypothetical protein C7120_09095 [Prevotella sp. oral taxon 376]
MPKDGKDGVIMFVKSYKRDWLFQRKLVLTPLLEEARAFFCDSLFELEVPIREFIAKLPCRVNPVNDYGMNELIAYNQFYIIAKHTRKGIEYYCSEKEVYDSKLKRRIQVPEFTKDINKAEFSKSIDSVNAILTRIRQNSNEKITSYGVFLTIENDLNKPNIIFALTNKISKKTRYLKSYDLNSKSSDRVLMCDYMDSALAVKYDEALKIYDDLHAKHKNLLVNLHIRNGGENTHAKDFKYKRESIQIGFKLKV